MTVETFDNQRIIRVSEQAQEHFATTLTRANAKAIRLTMKEAGCTGFKYIIEDVETINDDDIKVNLDNGVLVTIDKQFLSSYQGIKVDYVRKGLNFELTLNNPNVKDACGCGESVSF